MNNKGAEQAAYMRRLACTFVVGMQQSQVFSRRSPYIEVRELMLLCLFTGNPDGTRRWERESGH